ncbi:hypothetical protein AAG906_040143 [Vitis piasezkii]
MESNNYTIHVLLPWPRVEEGHRVRRGQSNHCSSSSTIEVREAESGEAGEEEAEKERI